MFRWDGSIDGSEPIVQQFVVAADNTITEGTICAISSGLAAVAATNATSMAGVAVSGGGAGDVIGVIINPGAIYAVADANVRLAGATLDLATGAKGVAASSNADLRVVSGSSATQPTRVIINAGEHYLT